MLRSRFLMITCALVGCVTIASSQLSMPIPIDEIAVPPRTASPLDAFLIDSPIASANGHHTGSLDDASAPPAGLRGSLSAVGVQYLASVLLPLVSARMKNYPLGGNVDGRSAGFDYEVKNIVLRSVSLGSGGVSLVNGPSITITGVSAVVTGDWNYELHIWPHVPKGGGGMTITISDAVIVVNTKLELVNGKPQLTVTSVNPTFDHIDVKCSGSIFSWFYDIIVGRAKGSIREAAESAVRTQVSALVNAEAAAMLATLPAKLPVNGTDMLIDLSFLGQPVFASAQPGYAAMYSTGSCESAATPSPSTLPHATLPLGPPSGAYHAQIDVDQYLFNSGLSLLQIPPFQMYASDKYIPLALNTDTFKALVPALAAFPNYTLSWRLEHLATAPLSFKLSPAPVGAVALGDMKWTWLMSNDTNPDDHKKVYTTAFVATAHITAGVHLAMENTAESKFTMATAQASSLEFALDIDSSNIGAIDPTSLQAFLNAMATSAIPQIPSYSVPLSMVPGLTFADPAIQYGQGFLSVLFTLHYVPPPTLLAPTAIMIEEPAVTLPASSTEPVAPAVVAEIGETEDEEEGDDETQYEDVDVPSSAEGIEGSQSSPPLVNASNSTAWSNAPGGSEQDGDEEEDVPAETEPFMNPAVASRIAIQP